MGLMKVELILFYCYYFCLLSTYTIVEGSKLKAEIQHDSKLNVTRINMDTKASIHLYRQWQNQAVSGLMAAVASKKILKVSQEDAIAHEACAKAANSVLKHAQCVSDLYRKPNIRVQISPDRDTRTLFNRLKPQQIHQPAKPLDRFSKFKLPARVLQRDKTHETLTILKNHEKSQRFAKLSKKRSHVNSNQLQHPPSSVINYQQPVASLHNNPIYERQAQKWRASKSIVYKKVGSFGIAAKDQERRKKRYVMKSATSYQLQDSTAKMSPLGMVARQLMKRILNLKNKSIVSSWQSIIDKAQQTAEKKRRLKSARQHLQIDSIEDAAFGVLGRHNFQNEDLGDLLADKNERKQLFHKMQQEPKNPQQKMTGLLRQGMKLAYSIFGKNTTNFDEKNLKVMSPKLFSVMNDNGSAENDDEPIDILSPSLLSLHGNGKGLEKELSLPNLVKGFTTADQQQWLDLIFEASGVEETLAKADAALAAEEFQLRKKRSYEEKMRSPDGQPLYFTKEKAVETLGDTEAKRIEISETLIKTYTKEQMKEMNETGYIVLDQKQLQLIYGPNSPYANAAIIEQYENFTAAEVHGRIEKEILNLTAYSYKDDAMTVDLMEEHRSKRDILLSPISGATVAFDPVLPSQPIILSPIIFSVVVGSPAIFGPVALSPWLFLPVILSPRTLSPPILSPLGFVPVILSPLTMHPVILCPGIFNPLVLSPLALSPFILSPQVFTPLILSPLVLSPFILNPSVASPVILSPFVLNPVIFSPLAYTALVLSPNALSPNIESKLYAAEVILSPSFLS